MSQYHVTYMEYLLKHSSHILESEASGVFKGFVEQNPIILIKCTCAQVFQISCYGRLWYNLLLFI